MIAQRILAVLAAVFLVGAVAIGSLTDPGWPLGQLIFAVHRPTFERLDAGIKAGAPTWLWDGVIHPLLVRPAWLLPASIGIVCAGLTLTLASREHEARSRRKRS